MSTFTQWKTETFFFCTQDSVIKMICVHTDPRKQLKTLYFACHASSWRHQTLPEFLREVTIGWRAELPSLKRPYTALHLSLFIVKRSVRTGVYKQTRWRNSGQLCIDGRWCWFVTSGNFGLQSVEMAGKCGLGVMPDKIYRDLEGPFRPISDKWAGDQVDHLWSLVGPIWSGWSTC